MMSRECVGERKRERVCVCVRGRERETLPFTRNIFLSHTHSRVSNDVARTICTVFSMRAESCA